MRERLAHSIDFFYFLSLFFIFLTINKARGTYNVHDIKKTEPIVLRSFFRSLVRLLFWDVCDYFFLFVVFIIAFKKEDKKIMLGDDRGVWVRLAWIGDKQGQTDTPTTLSPLPLIVICPFSPACARFFFFPLVNGEVELDQAIVARLPSSSAAVAQLRLLEAGGASGPSA